MSTNYRPFGTIKQKFSLPEQPVFDYRALMDSLKAYKHPRDKVTSLLQKNIIIRVIKGLYVHKRSNWGLLPVKELTANLMYGPSYISLQYALSAYGMVPEAGIHVTSVTFKKTKRYSTPLGDFIYRSVSKGHYLPGVLRKSADGNVSYLIASPEKALIDMLYFTPALRSMRDIDTYLLEDLRMDEDSLAGLDLQVLKEIGTAVETPKIQLCVKVLEKYSK